MSRTKADIISDAYSQLRIRGITVDPSTEENTLALNRLETMMQEFYGRNMCVGYNFEEDPDTSSNHNIPRKYWTAISVILACRLLPDFGKQATNELIRQSNAALTFLASSTFTIPVSHLPSNMPLGSGNTLKYPSSLEKFYGPTNTAPVECATNKMVIGDIENYTESFEAYVNDIDGESISSFTITSTTGLTVVSSSLTDNIVTYQISAVGSVTSEPYKVIIVATTSTGRKTTRVIYFTLTKETVD